MKNRVKIVDSLSYSTFHEIFNSTMVYMCMLIFDHVELCSSKSAYQNIKKNIIRNRSNVKFETIKYMPISVVERDDTIGGFVKYLYSGLQNFWQYLTTSKKTQLLYTNNNPNSILWISLFNFLFKKDIIIICHGELDILIRKPKLWKPSFYYKYIFLFLFKYGLIEKHLKMVVLGDSILSNIQSYLNKKNKRQFYSINHPYFFVDRTLLKSSINNPIQIGTVGTMTYAKGLQSMLNISKNIDKSNIRLSINGRIMESINYEEYPNIKFIAKNEEFIPREDYEKSIEALDYILFLYPTDSYKFIASGAIFDALDMGKPIITLNNDYFKHTLTLPIGYIATNEREIIEIINNLSQNNYSDSDYSIFINNIEKLKLNFTPEIVANDIINKIL